MKLKYTLLTLLGLALSAPFTTAQETTKGSGNIVTIFGQEKVEKTDEGAIFLHFRQGLYLPGGVGSGTLFNGQDMMAWLYARGLFVAPQAGDSLPYAYPVVLETEADRQAREAMARRMAGRRSYTPPVPWKWVAIQADSLERFQNNALRQSYLYTTYDSPTAQIVLLETTGGTRTYVNGLPHEGDHYDFGYTLTPIKLQKGLNEFVYTPGRFSRVETKLVTPEKPVMLTRRDPTLPDLITGEENAKWGAIRVINTTEKPLSSLTIRTTVSGKTASHATGSIDALSVRKLAFQLPGALPEGGKYTLVVELLQAGKVVDSLHLPIRQVASNVHHERTFISRVDGSVQYYSVAPALRQKTGYGEQKALVLSVHGAGVEARNQARAYKQKEWVDIVAATNRRPYGFNWEEWGRIDALEVLEEAKRIFRPDTTRIYLTGHSMGGHGTWLLGTTYPDKFAAMAPCASYPDISTYGSGRGDNAHRPYPVFEAFERGASAGRTLSMIRNLTQTGVYILHGDADEVVPVTQARLMRGVLSEFHPDFCYYEYPGGEHWFGDQSVDWTPIFEFFARHTIPANSAVPEIDFYTASPAISATDYWITVQQQEYAYRLTNVKARRDKDTVRILKAENVALLVLDLPSMKLTGTEAILDLQGQRLTAPAHKPAVLNYRAGVWSLAREVNPQHKYAGRYGGFKQAFDNHVVFVYGTKGTAAETEWNQVKARFDAETFYYRANGSIEVISDKAYLASTTGYIDRNVVLYGNCDNNSAWASLLHHCPIQVGRNEIILGSRTYRGDDLGTYFIYPHPHSRTASVGVVAGTGLVGMRATSPNNYISGITGFPDLMIFRADLLKEGLSAVEAAGFFNNDWSLNTTDLTAGNLIITQTVIR